MMTASPSELLELLCAPAREPRPAPRTMFIVAHPDDEAVSAGTLFERLREAMFVHVTNGAPLDRRDATAHGFATVEEYAAARRRELYSALSLAGISPAQTRQLGCVDQEASMHLDELARVVADLIEEIGPAVILTHPYEGGHPDHDATAFAVHAACRMEESRGESPPVIVEMTSYHNGPAGIETSVFLGADDLGAITITLSESQRRFKRALLDCFITQHDTLQYFPIDNERFRIAPRYDFMQPPHPGTLFYEMYPWGMNGSRFRQLAAEAMQSLGLEGSI